MKFNCQTTRITVCMPLLQMDDQQQLRVRRSVIVYDHNWAEVMNHKQRSRSAVGCTTCKLHCVGYS
jgi:hypothetical protein